MEKRRPHHDLEAFKRICGNASTLTITQTARATARSLGYGTVDVAEVVAALTPRMFYKSMTSYHDAHQWQDVYHATGLSGERIYLKFTDSLVTEFIVLSFKEKAP